MILHTSLCTASLAIEQIDKEYAIDFDKYCLTKRQLVVLFVTCCDFGIIIFVMEVRTHGIHKRCIYVFV